MGAGKDALRQCAARPTQSGCETRRRTCKGAGRSHGILTERVHLLRACVIRLQRCPAVTRCCFARAPPSHSNALGTDAFTSLLNPMTDPSARLS